MKKIILMILSCVLLFSCATTDKNKQCTVTKDNKIICKDYGWDFGDAE